MVLERRVLGLPKPSFHYPCSVSRVWWFGGLVVSEITASQSTSAMFRYSRNQMISISIPDSSGPLVIHVGNIEFLVYLKPSFVCSNIFYSWLTQNPGSVCQKYPFYVPSYLVIIVSGLKISLYDHIQLLCHL